MRLIPFFILTFILIFTGCGEENASNKNRFQTVIYDDFDAFDETTWQKADWNTSDPFYSAWCPDQIAFDSGMLTITLEQKACHGKTHAGGNMATYSTYTYGRYTVRMKAGDANGTISSFFTYTGPYETTPTEHDEIDFEIFGKDPTQMQVNYWRNDHEHPQVIDLGFDASADFHVYSFEWHRDYIKWYVDDILVHTVTENGLDDNDSLPYLPSKIMFNLWAGTGIDAWAGAYIDGTSTTAVYDYVKYEMFK